MVILAAGLTPAWQQILVVERLHLGAVNRARESVWCASGKVLNVACAVQHLSRRGESVGSGTKGCEPGAGSAVRALSVVGGLTGAAIREEFAGLGIAARWVETTVPTRVCTTVLDRATGTTTELVENSAALPAEVLRRFAEAFVEECRQATLVVISGSLPVGTPAPYWSELLQEVRCPVLLDVRGPELLACLPLRPWLVKPNREELGATLGRRLESESELLAGMEQLRAWGAARVVVSDGPQAVWACGPEGVERVQPPQVPVVNPIGSGDCFAAGLAVAYAEGRPWRESLEFAVAAAAENVQQLLPARIRRPDV